ncbi:hypothetical protein PanWU01x14_224490 [Parasponia andersonii]|uniref:Uncharacterized protein n=1 Tax=Parasponia andersonii TaxID=3476 RepID=A0A2P5BNA5_PARAD|nr:hypothetical protein PanWU01x14_224490 [Parasponia andersonii]
MLIVKQICPRSSQMLRDNFNECSTSLKWNKDRVRELETKLTSLQEELHLTKEAASANEEQLSAELSTVNKLVKLYKESSKEWSQKAGDLDGVIKALEEAADLKLKLEKCEAEIERSRKENELKLLPSNFSSETYVTLNYFRALSECVVF